MGTSPLMRRNAPPGKSPLASPRNSRSNLDMDMVKLAQETRRLSMEAANQRNRQSTTPEMNGGSQYQRRQSTTPDSTGRRSSESSSQNGHNGHHNGYHNSGCSLHTERRAAERREAMTTPTFSERRDSRTPTFNERRDSRTPTFGERRDSRTPTDRRDSRTPPIFSRKTSESLGLTNGNSRRGSVERKPSNELTSSELSDRRMSEAGLRRPSAGDAILNDRTEQLMVGMTVWVDGNKRGRIAYIGEVHFVKGEMAGVHLDKAIGKNNGTVGGVMYFQCEPKRGVFSRLHRLTLQPMVSEMDEY